LGTAAALRQLKVVLRGVIYIDEGWQKIVDSLHSAAVSSGVNFVTSSRVVAVEHDGTRVHGVALGGIDVDEDSEETAGRAPRPIVAEAGTRLPAERVVLAVDPVSARAMLGDAARLPETFDPVLLTCLDVALSSLPQPKATFAVGIDQPLYFSVHSQWAQLTPKGGALIHVARYGGGEAAELEALLDDMQPGWREVTVHRRFLPSMVVSNSASTAGVVRPAVRTPIEGVHLAGDWVGDEGMLSDAALASARAASKAILAS
jgi:phytoene dehydrogenase-like protein